MVEHPKQVDKDSGQRRAAVHNKWVRWTIAFLCILLGVVVALLVATALFDPFDALKSAWRWYFRSEPNPSMTERKDLVLGVASVVQALAVFIAGIVALAGLIFTRRTLLHNQETLRINQENTQRTLALTEQGQLTERFTQAIDQLGAIDDEGKKKLEVRLGGIYALERIAKESKEDYGPVMEVLTAYVRQYAHYPREKALKNLLKEGAIDETPLDPDIQAIITVIRRSTRRYGNGEHEPIDLHETDLRRANLEEANLRRGDFAYANLDGANLQGADLHNASLYRVRLVVAQLQRATLDDCTLSFANLRGANLQPASLREADLWGTNLELAFLSGADLQGANLHGANLDGARIYGADLRGASNLTQAQIEKAFGDKRTRLPNDHLRVPESWVDYVWTGNERRDR